MAARTWAAIIAVGSICVITGHRLKVTTVLPSLIKTADFATTYVRLQALCHQLRKLG
ncbi:hypothetical protein RQN30_03855 [Arcanobacterium hippocoleae]